MRKPVAATGSTVVYTIGKRTVACGLGWEALQRRDAKGRASELATIAKRRNSRDAVLLQTASGRLMAGFVPSDAPAKARRAVSAAVWLAVSVERPTVYMEQVGEDRWWYVVVRPGEVDISTDRVGSGSDVASALDDMLNEAMREPDWNETRLVAAGEPPPVHLFAQGVLTPNAGTFESLVDVDQQLDPRVHIKRVTGGVSPIALIAALAVVGAIVLGGTWYVLKVLRERAELEAAQAAAVAAQRSAAELATLNDKRIADAVAAALAADTATPTPDAFIGACLAAYMALPPYAAGWTIESVDCTPTSASSRWSRPRNDLSNNAALAERTRTWGAMPAFDPTGVTAVVPVRLAALENRAPLFADKLPVANALWLELGTWSQRTEHDTGAGIVLATPVVKALQYVDPRMNEGKNGLSPVPPEKLYQTGGLKVSGRGAIALKGVRITFPYVSLMSLRISPHSGANFDWNLEGTYVLANH